jgi:hypothetical protein
MLTHPLEDDKIGEQPTALATVYGKLTVTHGAVTAWSLENSATAKLDVGAALSLVVEATK